MKLLRVLGIVWGIVENCKASLYLSVDGNPNVSERGLIRGGVSFMVVQSGTVFGDRLTFKSISHMGNPRARLSGKCQFKLRNHNKLKVLSLYRPELENLALDRSRGQQYFC
jgi:hypothetical protein